MLILYKIYICNQYVNTIIYFRFGRGEESRKHFGIGLADTCECLAI